MILSIWLTHLLPIFLEVAIRQDQRPTRLPTQQPQRSIWCTYWKDLDLGILINHLFNVLIFRGVTIHKRYVPSYVQEICLPDLFLFANTHKEFSVFYSSRRVTMVLLLLTMVCVLGLYIIPIHMTCWSQECSSVLPLKYRLRIWFLSCSMSSGFCCCICCANCCPLCWTVLSELSKWKQHL